MLSRRQIAARADSRIGVMSEILNGIRVIKMYAWENAFEEVVDELRRSVFVVVHSQIFLISNKNLVDFVFFKICFILLQKGAEYG